MMNEYKDGINPLTVVKVLSFHLYVIWEIIWAGSKQGRDSSA